MSLIEQLSALGSGSPEVSIAGKERSEAQLSAVYDAWLKGPGSQIDKVVNELRAFNSELVISDSNLTNVIDHALYWCESEIGRCDRILAQHNIANESLINARQIVKNSTNRIMEINASLAEGVKDTKTLANALADIAPHVEGSICPVCRRDYDELGEGELIAHITLTIANLTSEAGRLQKLASERAVENERLAVAQRNLVSAEGGILDLDAAVTLKKRLAAITLIHARLVALQSESLKGNQIFAELNQVRLELSKIRKSINASLTLLPDVQRVVEKITELPTTEYLTLHDGLKHAELAVLNRILKIEARLALGISIISEFDQHEREFEQYSSRKVQQQVISLRSKKIKSTIAEVGLIRDTAKDVADVASEVRSRIVRSVFSDSLNAVWRDLFVRLAPSEQFIPQFQLPTQLEGRVEAVLETLHKSGQAGGTPGMMLSQGNLNTAALTLFLALHLSVPSQLPWLVLDDPVQSMDDLHISQFAALLRTLSKGLDKQLVVAVHERALFDYLTLELSPAFLGDRLLTLEISQDFNGKTIVDPQYFEFVVDNAVAA